MSELKPCPFCGDSDVRIGGTNTHAYAYCQGCSAEGPYNDFTADQAIESWNRRTHPQPVTPAGSLPETAVALDAAIDVLCGVTGERRMNIIDDYRMDHLCDAVNRIWAIGYDIRDSVAIHPDAKPVTPAGGEVEPATVVHNADTPGHFAIITPALPAGTKLYTHPPVADAARKDDAQAD